LPRGSVEVQNVEKFNGGHRPAIVVLPFQNLNDDIDQQYFCDGLANDLATDLSRFKNLVVVAAQTAFTLKNKVATAREIGRDLGVQYLLEGSVQRSAGRIRINAQLIDGATEHHIWANRFDWSADRLYELQDEIIQSIVVSLSIEVDAFERERAMRRERADMGAYDAYMKGFHLWQHHLQDDETIASLNEAQKWLELAAELDTRFSRPWGLLAYTYVWGWRQWWYGDDILDKANEYLKNAVDLEPNNYDNHWDLAYYYLAIREFELAEHEFDVARRLNSNDALLLVDTAELYCCIGQHQKALDLVGQAMALNPYYPDNYATSLAWIHYFTRDYQRALELLASVRHNTNEALLVSAAAHAQMSVQYGLEQQIELVATQSIRAQEKISEFLARRQQWTVNREKRSVTFLRIEDEQHWFDGLRKAGLPEK
jgi:TolB-like protein